MLKNYKGEKITPNQASKLMIADRIDSIIAEEMWVLMHYSNPTDKEIEEIYRHLDKHRWAILKKLGIV
jgi:hypothetical protein